MPLRLTVHTEADRRDGATGEEIHEPHISSGDLAKWGIPGQLTDTRLCGPAWQRAEWSCVRGFQNTELHKYSPTKESSLCFWLKTPARDAPVTLVI